MCVECRYAAPPFYLKYKATPDCLKTSARDASCPLSRSNSDNNEPRSTDLFLVPRPNALTEISAVSSRTRATQGIKYLATVAKVLSGHEYEFYGVHDEKGSD